jgi:hypothetical protein
LVLVTLLARLFFASAVGLGIDESYMVAAGRMLHLDGLVGRTLKERPSLGRPRPTRSNGSPEPMSS